MPIWCTNKQTSLGGVRCAQVRAELAPWEKKIGEVSGRVSVAASERDALARRAEDAKKRLEAALKVECLPKLKI